MSNVYRNAVVAFTLVILLVITGAVILAARSPGTAPAELEELPLVEGTFPATVGDWSHQVMMYDLYLDSTKDMNNHIMAVNLGEVADQLSEMKKEVGDFEDLGNGFCITEKHPSGEELISCVVQPGKAPDLLYSLGGKSHNSENVKKISKAILEYR